MQIATDGSGDLPATRLPVPAPAAGEVLIRVSHAGVNRADLFQREGSYPAPAETSYVPGLEVAGDVAAVGDPQKSRWKVGDKVCALVLGGGYAEYCLAPEGQVMVLPDGLSAEQAAGFPEALATSWLALMEKAVLKKGEVALIHGGSSGVGTAAIQLARAWGAEVVTTAGSDVKCDACRELGARAVNYKKDDFLNYIKAATQGRGADVILDMVGGDYAERNIRALAMHGRMVTIALLGGKEATVPLGRFLMKNLSWQALTLRSRSVEEKSYVCSQLEKKVWPRITDGTIRPVIDSVFPLAEAEKAHQRMQQGLHIGKIVLNMCPS